MLRLMKDGERPRPPDCGTGRAPLPATMACAALRPLRAFPTGTRHVFKQLLLDRQLRRAPTTRGRRIARWRPSAVTSACIRERCEAAIARAQRRTARDQ